MAINPPAKLELPMVPTGKDGGWPLLSRHGMQNGPCAVALHWILVACHSVSGVMMMQVIVTRLKTSTVGRQKMIALNTRPNSSTPRAYPCHLWRIQVLMGLGVSPL